MERLSARLNLLVIDFNGTEKKFVYPDAFEKYLTSVDQGLMAQVNRDLQVKNDAHATAVLSTVQLDPIPPKPQARKNLKRWNAPTQPSNVTIVMAENLDLYRF